MNATYYNIRSPIQITPSFSFKRYAKMKNTSYNAKMKDTSYVSLRQSKSHAFILCPFHTENCNPQSLHSPYQMKIPNIFVNLVYIGWLGGRLLSSPPWFKFILWKYTQLSLILHVSFPRFRGMLVTLITVLPSPTILRIGIIMVICYFVLNRNLFQPHNTIPTSHRCRILNFIFRFFLLK